MIINNKTLLISTYIHTCLKKDYFYKHVSILKCMHSIFYKINF